MIVVGIDSATRSGVATVHGERTGDVRLLHHGTFNGTRASSVQNVTASLSHLADFCSRGPVDHLVVIEEPYLDKNPRTAMLLARITGRWLQALETAGHPVELVQPSTWQQGLLAGLITPRSPRAQRKEAARRYVKAEFGVDVSEDEADAICIATWRLKQWRIESRKPVRAAR